MFKKTPTKVNFAQILTLLSIMSIYVMLQAKLFVKNTVYLLNPGSYFVKLLKKKIVISLNISVTDFSPTEV